MSSSKSTTVKPETRKKRFGRGLREIFGKKRDSLPLVSDSAQSVHSSEAESMQKHTEKPSITIEENTLPVVELVDVGASSNLQGALHAPIAQSRQSLTSHRSKGSFTSNRAPPHNE
jgi:hypothetical protein